MHFNSKFVKLGLAAAAPLLLISTVTLGSGVASAKKAPSETITCNTITATINFSPALVPTPQSAGYTKDETTTITGESVGGCSESPTAGTVTAATSATATVPPSKKGNACSTFAANAKKSKFSFVTNWNSGGGTSTAAFKGATQSGAGFTLSKGKVTGAYPTKAGTISVNLSSASTAAFAACLGGSGSVSTLTISSGSLTA